MIEPKRTLLWSASTPQASNTNITLEDSIDNYDEIMIYASAANTFNRYPITVFPVVSGKLNINGPLYFGKWGTGDNYILANGTRMGFSGNSAAVQSSYFLGKNNGSTAWVAAYQNNRASDVRPLRIYGLKYPKNYDMTLLWETTGNPYNTNITLNETVNHFDEIMVYGSGNENDALGWKTTKNIYQSQDRLMGIEPWGYTPWGIGQKYNYIIGCETMISGTSGHIGSAWCFGMNNSTGYGGFKWTGTEAPKMMVPWKIYGLKRRPTYNFYGLPSDGGSVSSNINPGYSGDIATITVTPESDVWRQSALNITGATLTGNDFMFGNSNVTVSASFEHSKDLTLVPNEHATLSADKMSGFSGDVVTVDATTDEGWYFTGLNVTGATATGNQFTFVGNDVTAEGLYTDEGYPITYETTVGGSCTGDTTIYIPGGTGITLQTAYNTYYRLSGYEVTGGTINGNVLTPTGPCTAKAVYKVNYFTARGNFEKGSNVTCDAGGSTYSNQTIYSNVAEKYAVHTGHTGDISTSWYSTSNRWKPNGASAYSITLNAKMTFTGKCSDSNADAKALMTGVTLVGSTQNQSQTFSTTTTAASTKTYNKTVTTTTQNVNYGVSARLGSQRVAAGGVIRRGIATYVATGTTGTWTATGIAP